MHAIEDFMKKDVTSIVDGVKYIGEILQEIPDQLGDCEGMQDDIARIKAWSEIFKHPFTLVPKLISNTMTNFAKIINLIDY